MKNYLMLLKQIMAFGDMVSNRTGIKTMRLEGGAKLSFDLREGFPAVTTKRLAFNAVKGELIGFLRGYDNAAQFRSLGCKIWDQNANENEQWLKNPYRNGTDDLGRIYGVQWRRWYKDVEAGHMVDQLKNLIRDIQENSESRRLIVNAWNPAELEYMALPPCHMLFQIQVNVERRTMSMYMYQRSCDAFLGLPFNIASYALLLSLIAKVTGYTPAILTMFLADVHIYENHFDQVRLQTSRKPYSLPALRIHESVTSLFEDPLVQLLSVIPSDIELVDYVSHDKIDAPMAV